MLSEHIEAALRGSLTGPALEDIARAMWGALGEGLLSWEEAGRLDELVREHRARMAALGGQRGPVGVFAAVAAAVKARAAPAAQLRPPGVAGAAPGRGVLGGMPSSLARLFTPGQVAVLSVVGREAARGRPTCELPLSQIEALAGVGRTTAQEALRLAKGLGLVWVRERRRRGERSETNVVTVLSKGWWRWLKRHVAPDASEEAPRKGAKGRGPGGGGFGKANPTNTEELRRGMRAAEGAETPPKGGGGGLEPRPRVGPEPQARREEPPTRG